MQVSTLILSNMFVCIYTYIYLSYSFATYLILFEVFFILNKTAQLENVQPTLLLKVEKLVFFNNSQACIFLFFNKRERKRERERKKMKKKKFHITIYHKLKYNSNVDLGASYLLST